ncbi:hypothetical protein E3Q23_01846 [Wallemia mellicola]|uniref:Uncharacterized protein n=1 Tax=Wallemia mellicola TaxID=1708541 RepID=A0A4T0SX19_9BASI|nr:hypothetical protein E3Q23_01846 [Wallemia mellicola]TIB88765.1 hypothetical protein E3Q21_00861 [Wallemia mellicola]TIB91373.1 hypothetical protein E3Q20_00847 [Wallemia mellicola]TIC36790.1 hypothetical protein E3Q09_01138 [Wallemia mellicola]TIC42835.1 hypothetical protein E3Q07_00885 [Wallemia mellicola]
MDNQPFETVLGKLQFIDINDHSYDSIITIKFWFLNLKAAEEGNDLVTENKLDILEVVSDLYPDFALPAMYYVMCIRETFRQRTSRLPVTPEILEIHHDIEAEKLERSRQSSLNWMNNAFINDSQPDLSFVEQLVNDYEGFYRQRPLIPQLPRTFHRTSDRQRKVEVDKRLRFIEQFIEQNEDKVDKVETRHILRNSLEQNENREDLIKSKPALRNSQRNESQEEKKERALKDYMLTNDFSEHHDIIISLKSRSISTEHLNASEYLVHVGKEYADRVRKSYQTQLWQNDSNIILSIDSWKLKDSKHDIMTIHSTPLGTDESRLVHTCMKDGRNDILNSISRPSKANVTTLVVDHSSSFPYVKHSYDILLQDVLSAYNSAFVACLSAAKLDGVVDTLIKLVKTLHKSKLINHVLKKLLEVRKQDLPKKPSHWRYFGVFHSATQVLHVLETILMIGESKSAKVRQIFDNKIGQLLKANLEKFILGLHFITRVFSPFDFGFEMLESPKLRLDQVHTLYCWTIQTMADLMRSQSKLELTWSFDAPLILSAFADNYRWLRTINNVKTSINPPFNTQDIDLHWLALFLNPNMQLSDFQAPFADDLTRSLRGRLSPSSSSNYFFSISEAIKNIYIATHQNISNEDTANVQYTINSDLYRYISKSGEFARSEGTDPFVWWSEPSRSKSPLAFVGAQLLGTRPTTMTAKRYNNTLRWSIDEPSETADSDSICEKLLLREYFNDEENVPDISGDFSTAERTQFIPTTVLDAKVNISKGNGTDYTLEHTSTDFEPSKLLEEVAAELCMNTDYIETFLEP